MCCRIHQPHHSTGRSPESAPIAPDPAANSSALLFDKLFPNQPTPGPRIIQTVRNIYSVAVEVNTLWHRNELHKFA